MKPERLTIQAFGSFADRQEIDFTVFGEHPMILINGPTGAGKSTLLDAICFALYGQTSADDRDASQMRAQYATAADLSEIEFDFSLGAARYRIRRVPQQKRPKKRGKGETDHNAEAQVWKLQGESAEVVVNRGMAQATDYIESLMGLNADQFRQVMVLPQGRFRELLVAKSTDREKIFSTLFDSAIYKRIEDSLKAQAKIVKDKVQSTTDQAVGKLTLVSMENERDLAEAIVRLEPQVNQLEINRQHANGQLTQAKKTLEQAIALEKTFESVEQLRLKLRALQDTDKDLILKRERLRKALAAVRLAPHIQALDVARANVNARELDTKKHSALLEETKLQEKTARESYVVLTTRMKGSEQSKQLLIELEQLLGQHDALVSRKKRVEHAKETARACERDHDKIKKELADRREQLDRQEAAFLQNRRAIEKLNEQQHTLNTLQRCLEARRTYDKHHAEIMRYTGLIKESESEIKTQSDAATQQHRKLSELELAWHTGAAAALAARLGLDEPCPVCGSTEHPQLATVNAEQGLVEHDQVELARSELDSLRQVLQKQQTQIVQWQERCDRLDSANQELLEMNPGLLDKTIDNIEREYGDLRSACNKLIALQSTLPETEKNIQRIKTELTLLEQRVGKSVADKAEAKALLASCTKEFQDALSAIPPAYQDKSVLQAKIDELKKSLKELEEAFLEGEKRLQSVSHELTRNTSVLEAIQLEYQRDQKILHSCIETSNAALSESLFVDIDDYRQSCLSEEMTNTIKLEIDEHEKLFNLTQGELEASLKAVAGKKLPDVKALSAIVAKVSEVHAAAEKKWQSERDHLNRLVDVQKSINESLKDTEKLRREYETIGRLSSVANGQSESRISLQRFVLSVLLDDVLIDATKRMLIMSRNRYQLVRRETIGGRQAAGLELDVLDTYSGKTRPVSTLSGGESFQAALSLALGLSDVVQAYSGGIRLDTLFIDEGFGSLDPDALELAINTLTDLQSSGRTIGVISHVTEMKEQITQRIDIQPSPTGSQIHVVT